MKHPVEPKLTIDSAVRARPGEFDMTFEFWCTKLDIILDREFFGQLFNHLDDYNPLWNRGL